MSALLAIGAGVAVITGSCFYNHQSAGFISFNEEIPFRSGCSRYGKEKSHDRRTVCKRGSC